MYKRILLSFILLEAVSLSEVNYYEILGVSKQASSLEIRQAYKKLAVKFHPDKNVNTANQEKFIQVTEAYENLKDPEKRRIYDLHGSSSLYSERYDHRSQSEYNDLYYNGLYHNDPFVDTLTGQTFSSYLDEGFHFINFYSPFCPPCQLLVEDWKKFAEMYKGIVKVGAVNCKYHNAFCYNSMRIASYPSLLFYPNGKHSNFVYYRGDRTLADMDQFVMAYLSSRVHVPVASRLRAGPTAYVLGAHRLERDALTRVAYRLNGIVNLAIVVDESLREKLTKNDYTTVVFKYNEITKEIESTEEEELLQELVNSLPKIDLIGPEEFKEIRNQLRTSLKSPWVFYFSSKGQIDRLQLYQMRVAYPDMYFGEIDCSAWVSLCLSLQVEAPAGPAWGVLKPGGAYQRARRPAAVRAAAAARRLHSLAAADLARVLDGDAGMWVLVVVPYRLSWEHIEDPFTETSLQFLDEEDISFGIMVCTQSTDKHCREVAPDQPAIFVQDGRQRHYFNDKIDSQHLSEFIQLLIDSYDIELDEQKVLEVMSVSGRRQHWLVAYLPARCGRACDRLAHEWRRVRDKLRPLESVRVGLLRCADGAEGSGGFCSNVRAPTARCYPLAADHHYTVSLQQLSAAAHILEWALEHIDGSVVKLNYHSFMATVAVEHIKPTSTKPWLVYFHSPRCHRCYEMYPDFAITGIFLQKAVNVGKVNCLTDRGLCQNEHITSYPSLRLYLNRNHRQTFSSVVALQLKDHEQLVQDVRKHLGKYDESLLDAVDSIGVRSQGIHVKHDEF